MDDLSAEVNSTEVLSGEESGGQDDEEEDPIELVHVDEDFFYMAHVMRLMAALHTLVSVAMLIAYYHLKVSLNFCLPTFWHKYLNRFLKNYIFWGMYMRNRMHSPIIKTM
jgi:hypothetical protein